MKKYGTADPHLGPPKSQAGAKSRPKWSPENGDQLQHPVPEEDEEEKKEDPSVEAVWTLCRGF